MPRFLALAALFIVCSLPASAVADQVIPDDLIVQSSGCFGFDCVDGESFGFDTLRLKENSTRLKFDDTSTTPGLPANDWQLTANDSNSGGQNYFSIDDVTGARTPLKVMAGAPTNALFLSPVGDLGLGTSSPGLDLHINRTDTPAIRLEQTNGGGFTAQTWDVGGNEANFFVRDLTGGSRLPFRIRPGAPTSSVDVAASGDVGVGTPSPTEALHVKRTDGSARVEIEEASTTELTRVLADLVNNGAPQLRFTNTAPAGTSWLAGPSPAAFVLRSAAPSAVDALRVTGSGELTSAGALQQNADPAAQEQLAPVTPSAVLEAIRSVPVNRFEYVADGSDARHLAPSASEFQEALRVGSSANALAPGDVAAAAFAGVQALAGDTTAIGQIDALAAKVTDLTGAVGAVKGDVATLKDTVAGLKSAIPLLATANAQLTARVDRLTKASAAQAKRLRRLERTVARLARG